MPARPVAIEAPNRHLEEPSRRRGKHDSKDHGEKQMRVECHGSVRRFKYAVELQDGRRYPWKTRTVFEGLPYGIRQWFHPSQDHPIVLCAEMTNIPPYHALVNAVRIPQSWILIGIVPVSYLPYIKHWRGLATINPVLARDDQRR